MMNNIGLLFIISCVYFHVVFGIFVVMYNDYNNL